uniref:Uncharacterized protein n=1 Tax=Knipowitschia caucasica TaxID=637954 RepID=A0AAV2KHC9_KNICA
MHRPFLLSGKFLIFPDPLVLTVAGELPKSPPPVGAIPDLKLLRPILHEIQSLRDELVQDSYAETRPRFGKLTMILDIMFFVLYFLTVVVFITYFYLHWAKRYFEDF